MTEKSDGSSLRRLIDEMVFYDDSKWGSTGVDLFSKRFHEYYDSGGINKYSTTYIWVHEINPENHAYITQRMPQIVDRLEKHRSKHLQSFEKLMDYLELEISRSFNIAGLKLQHDESKRILSDLSTVRSDLENEREVIKQELWDERKSSNVQSVTVLSIFTGIVMSFFGGFSLFQAALANMTQADDFKLIFIISFIGFVFFNTIFSLIYATSRMMHIDIKSSCKYGSCRDKDGKVHCNNPSRQTNTDGGETCGIWGKLIHKFSFIFVVNVIIVSIMICFAILYITNSQYTFYITASI